MAQEDEKPVREHDKFMLRLPDGMRERVAEEAKKNKRSMNAEIVARLEESFERNPSDFNALQIILDTNGLPLSWDEIWEHLRAINRAGQFNFTSQEVHVVTPELLSRVGREEEAEYLAKSYRRLEREAKGNAKKPKPSDTEGTEHSALSENARVATLLDLWIARQPDPKPTREEALTALVMQDIVKPGENSNDDVPSQDTRAKQLLAVRHKRKPKLKNV